MNRCILIGRVTTNIELKESQSGTKNISFSLAVPRNFKNSEGVTESDFISCKAFAKTAETIAKYVKKGNKLGVCGSVQCLFQKRAKQYGGVSFYTAKYQTL